MKATCAVVEDNIHDFDSINRIITHLSALSDHDFILSSFPSAQGLDIDQKFDLYILDIDLPKISGFQLANSIYRKWPEATIIFCTNHEDLVFDSFKLSPFYFVRKSFLKDDLTIALRKYIQNHMAKKNSLLICTSGRTVSIPYSEILYFEVSHNDLYIKTTGDEYLIRKTMKELLEEISNDQFIQISQSYVVNAAHITELVDDKVFLSNGQHIDISRRNIKTVRNKYNCYITR